jgi:TonB family protein
MQAEIGERRFRRIFVRPMAPTSSLLACWIAVAAFAEPSGSAAKDNVAYVIYAERPVYPFELRTWHIEGSGLFLLHVRADGSVQSVDTVRSTGNSILDGSAKAAFLRWRFRPGRSMNVKTPSHSLCMACTAAYLSFKHRFDSTTFNQSLEPTAERK